MINKVKTMNKQSLSH